MSRSHFYHIDAMVSNSITAPVANPVVNPVVNPATQPDTSRPTNTIAPILAEPVLTPSVGVLEEPILSTRPTAFTVQSISPTVSTVTTRPTITVPLSDVVPFTVTVPTATISTPTYGGGGGGGAINTGKPMTKELTITPTKPSFLKRNLLPILLIGSAVFILIKKPIK